jgi:hypothetical protein
MARPIPREAPVTNAVFGSVEAVMGPPWVARSNPLSGCRGIGGLVDRRWAGERRATA